MYGVEKKKEKRSRDLEFSEFGIEFIFQGEVLGRVEDGGADEEMVFGIFTMTERAMGVC